MYLLLNNEPYAIVDDFTLWSNGSLGCNLVGINVDTSDSVAPKLQPIYRPWATFTKRPGQFTIDIPTGMLRTLIISFIRRWPFINIWKEDMTMKKL